VAAAVTVLGTMPKKYIAVPERRNRSCNGGMYVA
jgi:hypothetical protein